jgi:hypothetical protein
MAARSLSLRCIGLFQPQVAHQNSDGAGFGVKSWQIGRGLRWTFREAQASGLKSEGL